VESNGSARLEPLASGDPPVWKDRYFRFSDPALCTSKAKKIHRSNWLGHCREGWTAIRKNRFGDQMGFGLRQTMGNSLIS
jgi:hypothetical protein